MPSTEPEVILRGVSYGQSVQASSKFDPKRGTYSHHASLEMVSSGFKFVAKELSLLELDEFEPIIVLEPVA